MTIPELPSPQDMMRQTDELKKRFEAMCESIALSAKLIKVTYDNLIESGFTEEQALRIVIGRGSSLL